MCDIIKSEPVERVPEPAELKARKNRVPEPAERRNPNKNHRAFRRNAGTQKKNLGGTQKSKFCPERVPKHPWSRHQIFRIH